MATEKKTQQPEQKPRERREAHTERKPASPHESREGMPGYGQPPEEVREQHLPEQEW